MAAGTMGTFATPEDTERISSSFLGEKSTGERSRRVVERFKIHPNYLKNLTPETNDENFKQGLEHLISIADQHLQNALKYTQLLPTKETGLRNFCLWALGMAVLTLKNIKNNLNFNDSDQVKITRKDVKTTILVCKLTARSNTLLSLLFNVSSRSLKTPDWQYAPQTAKE